MMWLDTHEEVDMDSFFEALENGEIYLVSRTLTEEDHKEISRELAAGRAAIKQREAAKQTATHQKPATLGA